MKLDVLSVLEAAYAPAATLDDWARRVLTAADPVLDAGFGVLGHRYTVDDNERVSTGPTLSGARQLPSWFLASGMASVDALNAHPAGRAALARTYPRAPIARLFSEALAPFAHEEPVRHALAQLDAAQADIVGMLCGDPSGHGVILSSLVAPGVRLDARANELWTRVAAHIASAYRLQRRAHADVDAVLHPDGRVAHAEPTAQAPAALATLRDETRAIDRARGALRRADPDEALAVWNGLVDGQWSLVDQVDSDGRRYVFARRNAPAIHAWSALSARELQVVAYASEGLSHKAIAYALGIKTATVATHLQRAARKVGVDSRLALARAYRARGASAK